MKPFNTRRAVASGLLPLLAAAVPALAQQIPDAGQLLRQQPTAPVPSIGAPPVAAKPPAETKAESSGPTILVKGFRIVGASLVPESELQALLADAIGKELRFSQLQDRVLQLAAYYAYKGYMARVFIAPQEFVNGVVTLTVVEGRLGQLKLDDTIDTNRIDVARMQRFISARVQPGKTLTLGELGGALNILNEQPGIAARSTLRPGRGEGEVDVLLSATATPLASYGLQFNNNGNRATGEQQLSGSAVFSNPTGHFDQVALVLNAAEGVAFVSGDYSLAVGDRGLRVGANASQLRYRAIQAATGDFGSKGDASTFGINASYPLQRNTYGSLSLNASLNRKHMTDEVTGIETANRTVNVGSVGFSGWRINPAIGGISRFGADLSTGRVDRSRNAGDLNQDALGRQTNGEFTKLAWRLGHMAPLGERWNLVAGLSGQFANRGLESSERFALGGPNGVRAYPAGEGQGDEGWLLTVNLLRPLNDTTRLRIFLDHGEVRLNKTLWANWNDGNPNLPNRYALSGIGGGVDWKVEKNLNLALTLATPLGNNPGRNSNGRDADGRRSDARLWVSLVATF